VINAIRAHFAEFGIVAPIGRNGVEQLLGIAREPSALLAALKEYRAADSTNGVETETLCPRHCLCPLFYP
jgi:hypothetical protein